MALEGLARMKFVYLWSPTTLGISSWASVACPWIMKTRPDYSEPRCDDGAGFGSMQSDSGVGSAIHGQIRSGDVGSLWTGYKRHESSNFVHGAIAVERRVCLLRRCPVA
jgi:hypothetical protein